MAEVFIYTTAVCPYCVKAKTLLNQKKVAYKEIRVDLDEAKRNEMMEKSNRRTVPQIFINGIAIGGYDDLYALEMRGELNNLLKTGSHND